MNYNIVFAPTARAERLIKGHALNFTTYALIAAVLILTAAEAVLEFIAYHVDRRELYALNIRIAKLRTKTFFIRRKLTAVRVLYRVLSNPVVLRISRTLKRLWANRPALTIFSTRLFCLTDEATD